MKLGDLPAKWIWTAVTFLAVVFIAVAALGYVRLSDDEGANVSAAAPSPVSFSRQTTIDVIGDSYSEGTNYGGLGQANWLRVVNARLGDSYNLIGRTAGGAGYVKTGERGLRFSDLADGIADDDPSLVIVMGSRNDVTSWNQVGGAATDLYASIRKQVPNAKLMVVSPPWVNAAPPPELRSIRDTLRQKAASVGATFVDTLAAGWFYGQPTLIGSDGVHPTDEGHRYVADRMGPAIRSTLGVQS